MLLRLRTIEDISVVHRRYSHVIIGARYCDIINASRFLLYLRLCIVYCLHSVGLFKRFLLFRASARSSTRSQLLSEVDCLLRSIRHQRRGAKSTFSITTRNAANSTYVSE